MSTLLNDGSWTRTEKFPEALRTFVDAASKGTARCLVVGDEAEVEAEKDRISAQGRLDELERRLSRLEDPGPIQAPTPAEILKYGDA